MKRDDFVLRRVCYDGKGPSFPRLRGSGSKFLPLPMIDDATGCLLFLVFCRNGVLSGQWSQLMRSCFGDSGADLPLTVWVKTIVFGILPEFAYFWIADLNVMSNLGRVVDTLIGGQSFARLNGG